MARAGQGLIGFQTAFEHPRFAASGKQGQEVGGAEDDHFLQGVLARAGTTLGGDGVLPMAHSVQGAFEADLIQRRAFLPGALEHDAAHQVVGDGMEKEFALHHRGGEAAHVGSLHGGLNVVEIEFHPPAPLVEGHEGFHRPKHGSSRAVMSRRSWV